MGGSAGEGQEGLIRQPSAAARSWRAGYPCPSRSRRLLAVGDGAKHLIGSAGVHVPFRLAEEAARVLLYIADDADEDTDEHEGFVAGERPDRTLTDIWNPVGSAPDPAYSALVPRCECGWRGPPFSVTPAGYAACEQLWRSHHLAPFLKARQPNYGRPSPAWRPHIIEGGFVPEIPEGHPVALRDGA